MPLPLLVRVSDRRFEGNMVSGWATPHARAKDQGHVQYIIHTCYNSPACTWYTVTSYATRQDKGAVIYCPTAIEYDFLLDTTICFSSCCIRWQWMSLVKLMRRYSLEKLFLLDEMVILPENRAFLLDLMHELTWMVKIKPFWIM